MNNTISFTWNKLLTLCTAIIFPGLGILVTLIIFGTRLVDKVDGVSKRVDAISERQDKQDEKLNAIGKDVDQVKTKQEVYQATHP